MVSYNRLVEMFKGLFGLEISEGAIANIFSRTHAPFAAEAGRIDAEVRAAAVIASDETSARVEGQTCWQWVFGSATAVAHRIAASRGKAVVEPDTEAGLKLRRGMEKCQDKLFVFVTRRDVPPTNNISERRLRPSVIFRK